MKLAVAGEIRSGKDTVCDYIKTKFDEMQTLYFAEGIAEIIERFFPEAWYSEGKPRWHYQEIGQKLREVNPDVWVTYTNSKYKKLQDAGFNNFICTDLRQPNEYQWLKDQGFIVIKVEADPEVRLERMKKAGDKGDMQALLHPVEQQIKHLKYDYLITNNTTLEDLYKQVDFVLKEERGNS
ncbi:deoxynucleotide monophosphate kinase family protein [Halobacillus karajensis]|uniref:deoxynucleotide monophosphate kinase family protein n=1 Tax=Halobacillus karajensis TaxID=195088 RepID=UPI00045C429A|nr:hypothetical protein [Halobacillus karajensis]CDQ21749.1 deoxynucleoside monophosphate kinase [Halobacillus karajensis]